MITINLENKWNRNFLRVPPQISAGTPGVPAIFCGYLGASGGANFTDQKRCMRSVPPEPPRRGLGYHPDLPHILQGFEQIPDVVSLHPRRSMKS